MKEELKAKDWQDGEGVIMLSRSEIRARAFEDAAKEMDRLVKVMEQQRKRVITEGQFDWPSGYIADREGHAVWLRKWAEEERSKDDGTDVEDSTGALLQSMAEKERSNAPVDVLKEDKSIYGE